MAAQAAKSLISSLWQFGPRKVWLGWNMIARAADLVIEHHITSYSIIIYTSYNIVEYSSGILGLA